MAGRLRGEERSRRCGKGLTDDNIRDIRNLPLTQRAIAEMFGISGVMVHFIQKRKKWAHVADEAPR